MGKILNIVETAYRATLEEQDDTVLWLTGALRAAGADIAVLLRGNAVNYVVKGQDASGLAIGSVTFGNPPRIDRDLGSLRENGVTIYAIREDARDRGLDPGRVISGIEFIARSDLADLVEKYDQVWYW
jgi:sulfur transfer complex TusBCD TusB component (DsrH family)